MSAGKADLILPWLSDAIDQDEECSEGKIMSSFMDTPRFKCHTEMAIRLLEHQKDCRSCRCKLSVTLTEMIGEAVGLDERREGDPDRNLEQATHWEKTFVKYLSNKGCVSRIYQIYIFSLPGFKLFTQVSMKKEKEDSVGDRVRDLQ